MGHENGGWMNEDQRDSMKESARKAEMLKPPVQIGFPKRILLRIEDPSSGDGYWKELCVVFDNEALGLLQRKIFDWTIKVESTQSLESLREAANADRI